MHERRGVDEIDGLPALPAAEELLPRERSFRAHEPERPAPVVDEPAARPRDPQVGMPLHEGELPLDLFGKEQVVGVQPGDPVAPGLLEPPVRRRRHPPVFLGEDPHPPVGAGVALHDGQASVRGAVVDDDKLQLPVGLAKDALDRLCKVLFPVMHGNDDGDVHSGGSHLFVSVPSGIIWHETRAR